MKPGWRSKIYNSDNNNNPWEHDTSRQERDHIIYNDELDTVSDLELD